MTRSSLLLLVLLAQGAGAEDVPFFRCFDLASQRHEVPLDLLIGVARVESNFNPDAKSHANAHGIMQIRWPLTARHLGVKRLSELYNPCVNIDIGATYLAELLDRYRGNTHLALAAYNYGPTRIQTLNDIPRSVEGYVTRVHSSKPKAAGERSGALVVNTFTSLHRAESFAEHLAQLTSAAAIRIMSAPGRHDVSLSLARLTAEDAIRLNRLLDIEV